MRVGPERSEGPYRIASERFTNILTCSTWFTREIKWGCKKPMDVLYYYYQNPNIKKLNELTRKKKMLGKLCFFIFKIYDAVRTHNP